MVAVRCGTTRNFPSAWNLSTLELSATFRPPRSGLCREKKAKTNKKLSLTTEGFPTGHNFYPPPLQYNQVRHGNVGNWQKLQRTRQLQTVATTPAFGTRLGKSMTDISITSHRGVISLGIPLLKNKNPGHVIKFRWRGAVKKLNPSRNEKKKISWC
jgi:hypothetical protein